MMKLTRFGWLVVGVVGLLLITAVAAILEAQTTLAPRNLAPTIPGGIVFVIAPDGRTAFARLDSSIELTADAAGFLVLRAVGGTISDRVIVFKPTVAQTTLTLPSDPQGNSVQVACNGSVLSEPDDYARAARVLTFVPKWAPSPGDLCNVRYRE